MEQMQLSLASQDDFLLATASGQASLKEILRVFKSVDTATEQGFDPYGLFGGEGLTVHLRTL